MNQPVGIATGTLRRLVRLENPGTPQDDGDGGFTETWEPLNPSVVSAGIELATARSLERLAANTTVVSDATYILHLHYHPGVTTKTRIIMGPREFYVTGVLNPEERNISTIVVVTERVP